MRLQRGPRNLKVINIVLYNYIPTYILYVHITIILHFTFNVIRLNTFCCVPFYSIIYVYKDICQVFCRYSYLHLIVCTTTKNKLYSDILFLIFFGEIYLFHQNMHFHERIYFRLALTISSLISKKLYNNTIQKVSL